LQRLKIPVTCLKIRTPTFESLYETNYNIKVNIDFNFKFDRYIEIWRYFFSFDICQEFSCEEIVSVLSKIYRNLKKLAISFVNSAEALKTI